MRSLHSTTREPPLATTRDSPEKHRRPSAAIEKQIMSMLENNCKQQYEWMIYTAEWSHTPRVHDEWFYLYDEQKQMMLFFTVRIENRVTLRGYPLEGSISRAFGILLLLLLLSCFSRVWLCVTPQTAAHQAPLSLGFSRQEHWSGLPFPSPMHTMFYFFIWMLVSGVWLLWENTVSCTVNIHGLFYMYVCGG